MKIGIDVSPLYMHVSGISNYVRHILQGLAVTGSDHSFVLYTNKAIDFSFKLPDNFSVRVVRLPFHKMQIWFQVGLPLRMLIDGIDVFLGPFHRIPLLSTIPSVLTIHDLSGLLLKDLHVRSVVARNSLIPFFVSKARRIIAVSQFTSDEIRRTFPKVGNSVDVILEAPSPALTRVTDETLLLEVRDKLNLPDRFILFLGTLEPRKNLPALLKAYESIAGRITQDIVLTGRMGWGSTNLKKLLENNDIRERIHLTGFVDDEYLPSLLSMADIVAYPALYEGFGLPVVEAMACGTPVLTSSVSSLPEAAGGAAILVNPESVEDISSKLLEMATDEELRKSLAIQGLARVSKLSWNKVAEMTLDSCRRAVGTEKGSS